MYRLVVSALKECGNRPTWFQLLKNLGIVSCFQLLKNVGIVPCGSSF